MQGDRVLRPGVGESLGALQRPPPLRPGDRVVVVAPSGPVDPARLARGCLALESLGLDVEVAPHVLDRLDPPGYLAGSDVARSADLQTAWCSPATSAVVCARGGYGAVRLLDHLDWDALGAAAPTVLLGSSDVTALHLAVGRRLGLVTHFGPMPAGELLGGVDEVDAVSLAALRRALMTDDAVALRAESPRRHVDGTAEGITCGGTLTLLAAALGTPDLRAATGGIVVLEDVAEAAYRVDRMLTSLLRAGYFDGVAGIALGTWERCGAGVHEVLAERLSPLGVPVLGGFPIGHGRRQLTVPLGVPARLDTESSTLTVGRV